MSPHPYTEDQLVEQPAIALLAELGWTTVNALDEVLGLEGTFGRETRSDVVLAANLRAALVRLNPDAPSEAITAAIDQLIVDRSAMSLVAANREVYLLLIETYNSGSRNIDDLFRDLLALTQALTEEQQRHVREQLSEEELTVFDLLTRPGPDLTPEEREEVKKVARHILERVRQALVLNWRQKAQARARVKLVIEDTLDEGLPRVYTPELYTAKCSRLFEHVYESFGA